MQPNIDFFVNWMTCHMVSLIIYAYLTITISRRKNEASYAYIGFLSLNIRTSTYLRTLMNDVLARTIRSVSCHNFAANQRSDSVKRSSTEQQVNPGREHFLLLPSSDLLENALYLTEIFTLSSKNLQLSTLSLDSIEKDHDQFDLFLYDSLNDESDDDNEQFYDCSNNTILFQTIANERQLIEQLTHRCSSLDSLDNYGHRSYSSRKTFSMM